MPICPPLRRGVGHCAAFGPGLPGSPQIEKNLTQNFLGWLVGHTGSTAWEGTGGQSAAGLPDNS